MFHAYRAGCESVSSGGGRTHNMPVVSSTSTQQNAWKMRSKDVKSYLHFDKYIKKSDLEKYVQDDISVSKHSFYPLILFKEGWIKFRKNGVKNRKIRPLRYSARKDAAIYAYHRFFLSNFYERELERRNITNIPIAYRKIPKNNYNSNKCNIDFAKDTFDCIKKFGNCDVTVVDISSFFEKIDHAFLKEKWCEVLGRELNEAENAVFKSITNYAVVDRDRVFERLGLYEKFNTGNRRARRERKLDQLRRHKHRQICDPSEFRQKICGADSSLPSLIQKNTKNYGIPQGTPISDLLANIYMIDFDKRLNRWCRNHGGQAFRYCDDIIVIFPSSKSRSYDFAKNYLKKSIGEYAGNLVIKDQKVAVGRFIVGGNCQYYTRIMGQSSHNGIEYLGFQYNGKVVQLRNSTMSNAWRKVKRRSYGWAKRWVRQYRAKGDDWLRANAPIKLKTQEILQCVSVQEKDFRKWTFNKYAKRCERTFFDYKTNISSQTKKYRRQTESVLNAALTKAIRKHGFDACERKEIKL